MDYSNDGMEVRKPNPRRRRISRIKKIMRAYLPLAAVVALVVLFVIFASNSIKRADAKREQERLESLAIEESLAQVRQELENEAKAIVEEADQFAAACEFDKAIAHLDTYSGNPEESDIIKQAKDRYVYAQETMVPVEDITQIKFLSFGTLQPDTSLFNGEFGEGYRYTYITGNEFTRILQELYEAGFMLVDFYDIFTTTQAEDGSTLILQNELLMPEDKKPIVLIGKVPGNLSPDDPLSTEGTDFVPLLEAFIQSNPGFSYKGARAILATTGSNGMFGQPLTETANITKIAQALIERGYVLASNTYADLSYGNSKLETLKNDLASWNVTATPLLGKTELMVYSRGSDIDDGKDEYSGAKYEALYEAGFRYFFGVCYSSTPWMNITDNTIRIGTITVNGENLLRKSTFFEGLFDVTKVIEY